MYSISNTPRIQSRIWAVIIRLSLLICHVSTENLSAVTWWYWLISASYSISSALSSSHPKFYLCMKASVCFKWSWSPCSTKSKGKPLIPLPNWPPLKMGVGGEPAVREREGAQISWLSEQPFPSSYSSQLQSFFYFISTSFWLLSITSSSKTPVSLACLCSLASIKEKGG